MAVVFFEALLLYYSSWAENRQSSNATCSIFMSLFTFVQLSNHRISDKKDMVRGPDVTNHCDYIAHWTKIKNIRFKKKKHFKDILVGKYNTVISIISKITNRSEFHSVLDWIIAMILEDFDPTYSNLPHKTVRPKMMKYKMSSTAHYLGWLW